jgi:hypothetical protein
LIRDARTRLRDVLGQQAAPDEQPTMEKAAMEFKVPATKTDGDTAMTRRKDEITPVISSATGRIV